MWRWMTKPNKSWIKINSSWLTVNQRRDREPAQFLSEIRYTSLEDIQEREVPILMTSFNTKYRKSSGMKFDSLLKMFK